MALGTPASAVTPKQQGAGQTITTASFTPTANALLLAQFHGQGGSAPAVPTVSDSAGLTWTLVTSSGGTFNSTNRCLVAWAIAPASPFAMTDSGDWGASITGSPLTTTQTTGADATTPILAGSTAGTSGSSVTPAPGTVPAITSGNVQLLFVATRAGSVSPEGGAWAEVFVVATGSACTSAAYYCTAGDTSPTATTASSPWRASAAEISVATESGGFTINGSRTSVGGRWRRPAALMGG